MADGEPAAAWLGVKEGVPAAAWLGVMDAVPAAAWLAETEGVALARPGVADGEAATMPLGTPQIWASGLHGQWKTITVTSRIGHGSHSTHYEMPYGAVAAPNQVPYTTWLLLKGSVAGTVALAPAHVYVPLRTMVWFTTGGVQ